MTPELTRRQREILDLLREQAREHTMPPSLTELCGLLGLRSRGSLHKHIQALIAAGYVEPLKGRRSGIRLSARAALAGELPLLGRIAAGQPIEALTWTETIAVPEHLRSSERDCYVLAVTGDSMREAGILDGDLIVIEHREQARDGEVVVALIHGEGATLKVLSRRPGRVCLRPCNAQIPVLEFAPSQVQIQGVVVGLMRTYASR